MPNKIDRNADTPKRIMRNFQRIKSGASGLTFSAPLAASNAGVISLTLSATGGLQVTGGALALKLVDTSLVLAAGGVGVALAANSALAISSGLKVGLLTTKGDLFTFSTVNARLGVGSNNQVLIADSTQTTGLKWGGASLINDTVALTAQGADIGSTNFANSGTAGTYRVSYALETTTADGAAGTVTVTFAYTDSAGATTVASAALALTALGRTTGVFYVQLASGNVAYSTAHTGIYGTAKYALFATLERLS